MASLNGRIRAEFLQSYVEMSKYWEILLINTEKLEKKELLGSVKA